MIHGFRRPLRVAALVATAATVAACGKDSSGSTSPGGGGSLTGLTIVIDSASKSQTATIGTAIQIGLRVSDATATNGVANQTVTFSPDSGNGSVAPTSATSDASGRATVSWTLGTRSGTNTLKISVTGATSTVTATATAGPFAKLVKVTTDSQTVVASASASLVVRSADQYGNPVPNVPVTWTATGGTLTPAATTTGASGNASVTFTTTATPATTYTITATAAGAAPITFTLTGS